MYRAVVDSTAGLMVGRYAAVGDRREDGSRMAKAVLAFAALPARARRLKVYLLLVDEDALHSGAEEREQIAAAWRSVDSSETLFCVVTHSVVARATFHVVGALRLEPDSVLRRTFANVEYGVAWIEERRPGVKRALAALERRLSARLTTEACPRACSAPSSTVEGRQEPLMVGIETP